PSLGPGGIQKLDVQPVHEIPVLAVMAQHRHNGCRIEQQYGRSSDQQHDACGAAGGQCPRGDGDKDVCKPLSDDECPCHDDIMSMHGYDSFSEIRHSAPPYVDSPRKTARTATPVVPWNSSPGAGFRFCI